MRCPKCEKPVEFKKKQVSVDENGQPVLNEYAICRDCKKQWNLDKQKAQSTKTVQPCENTAPVPSEPKSPKPQTPQENPARKTVKKSITRKDAPPEKKEQTRYSNIPPKNVRDKKETDVKQNYKDMLDADSDRRPPLKKKKSSPKRNSARKRPVPSPPEDFAQKDVKPLTFRAFRIVMGILSIAMFGLLAYKAFIFGLDDISAGSRNSIGAIFIAVSMCMLISGILLLIMQAKASLFAFMVPMVCYIGGAALAFLGRNSDKLLFFISIGGAVLSVTFIILAVLSRSHSEDDAENDIEEDIEEEDDIEDDTDVPFNLFKD